MAAIPSTRLRALLLRIVLGLTAVSLLAYVPYRYAVRPPGWEGVLGTLYALLFPIAALLAVAGLAAAVRPSVLRRLRGSGGAREAALRTGIGVYAGLWVLMGLMCVPSLSALAETAPVKGLFSTVHMTAQHVFLGFAAVATTWRPAAAEALLRGEAPGEEPAGEEHLARGRSDI